MKKLFLFLFMFSFLYAIDLPTEPKNPQIDEYFSTQIPPIEDPFVDIKTNSFVYFIKAKLYFSDGKVRERVLFFSNIGLLSFTNNLENEKTKKIYSYSIYQIDRIEIAKWKATQLSNNLYLFTPDFYKIYLKEGDLKATNFVEVSGNINYFNVLFSKNDEKTENFYTIFYDYWISGKNKFFRWKNSKSVVFEYNLTNPLPDVVVKIEFLW